MCRWGCPTTNTTYMCKYCGTRYCKECLRGEFYGLMLDSSRCRICNQKKCQGDRVEYIEVKQSSDDKKNNKKGAGRGASKSAKKSSKNTKKKSKRKQSAAWLSMATSVYDGTMRTRLIPPSPRYFPHGPSRPIGCSNTIWSAIFKDGYRIERLTSLSLHEDQLELGWGTHIGPT